MNISEGSNRAVIENIVQVSRWVGDVHSDPDHGRSVITLLATEPMVLLDEAKKVARRTIDLVDFTICSGVHPRMGVVDVVPFVSVDPAKALVAEDLRDHFAQWIASSCSIPAFLYGGNRSLPEVRRDAFDRLDPDFGPKIANPTSGACAVGARPTMVAFNVNLDTNSKEKVKDLPGHLRKAHTRVLSFSVGGLQQISANLLEPDMYGPDAFVDDLKILIAERDLKIVSCELVGLIPYGVLSKIPKRRWSELDVTESQTIEYRLKSLI